MTRARALATIALAAVMAASGCKSVYVRTVPAGAEVLVDGEVVGRTPCKFRVKTFCWLDYQVEVRKPGYKTHVEPIDVEFGPSAQWQLIYSLIGILTAPLALLTPFMGDVIPNSIFVVLEPDLDETPPPETGLVPSFPPKTIAPK